MRIKVTGFDPSTTNFGICKASVDIDSLEVFIDDLILFKTENETKKGVIKTSDDLRRAREIVEVARDAIKDAGMVVSEIPLGTASLHNNAILNSGVMIGILASIDAPIIQVSPADVKIAAVGHRHACKEEMIEWAIKTYPNAPWKMRKLKGKLYPTAANEHLADATAVVLAGVRTQQFKQAVALYKSFQVAA
jgi:Holliday junction resolvasome RuvABC endonuclease subunit